MVDKQEIDRLLPQVYAVLQREDLGIVKRKKDGRLVISRAFRGQIASFGAAITMGSLLAAVAFFSQQNKAMVDRSRLMKAIYLLLNPAGKPTDSLFDYIHKERKTRNMKEPVVNACVALKLAMNLFVLDEEGSD